jgi:methanogenic corrinoid protein MtbC1
MARTPLDMSGIDSKAYAEAEEAFRLAKEHLPDDLISDVAREVVRRLAFRMPGVEGAEGYPTDADIERFCAALLSNEEDAADRIILAARRDGAEIETIYLGYIAGASRRLGAMWETDQASFIDVSLGTGRLYRIIRGLRHAIAPVILEGKTRTPALFVLVPGETHSLGIEMAADLFRRDGGDVDVCIGQSHDEILRLADTRHYGVVVLVANTERVISALVQISVALRISQPLTPFALAGNLVDKEPEAKSLVGAELVISDVGSAMPDLRRLTEQG